MEMADICNEVSSELAKIGRQDLNIKLARFVELTGQEIDLVFELGNLLYAK